MNASQLRPPEQEFHDDGNYPFVMARTKPATAGEGSGISTPIDWQSALAQHDRWLRTIAYARLYDADGVDEVMQEVSLAAVRQSAPLADHAKVAPWLYQLTVRQSLLYRRKLGRRRKLNQRYADRFQPTEIDQRTTDPLLWLMADERRQWVREALSRLNARDAEILLLKYTENWSYRELAEHLGISHSAVEARLHRARKRLRAKLTQTEAGAVIVGN